MRVLSRFYPFSKTPVFSGNFPAPLTWIVARNLVRVPLWKNATLVNPIVQPACPRSQGMWTQFSLGLLGCAVRFIPQRYVILSTIDSVVYSICGSLELQAVVQHNTIVIVGVKLLLGMEHLGTVNTLIFLSEIALSQENYVFSSFSRDSLENLLLWYIELGIFSWI